MTGGVLGAVTNSGLIRGAGGVRISGGVITSITNSQTGWIQGTEGPGVFVLGGSIGTITNSGSISGKYSGGVYVSVGAVIASIINSATGSIFFGGTSGSGAGINVVGGSIGTVTNSGSIYGTLSGLFGLAVSSGGIISSIANSSGGVIFGTGTAVQVSAGSIGALSNSGTIKGGTIGIALSAGGIGSITNGAGGTISGVKTAVAVSGGVLGVLSNSGSIGRGTVGVGVGVSGGSVTAIINNSGGLISGRTAILAGGAIGAITNAGTISGVTAIKIASGGSIGQITNNGTISGPIVNISGLDLTIAGGTGSVYGVLSGPNGSIGTVSDSVLSVPGGSIFAIPQNLPSGGDVTLSGNNLLNDMLILGGHKLVNTGVLQVNNGISITGGFSQAGGSLISGVTTASKYGELFVSGAAAVTGGVVGLLPFSPGILAVGQTYTLVQASSLTVGSLTAQVPSFTATISTVVSGPYQDLLLTLGAPTNWTSVGRAAGGPAAPVGVALDQIAAGSSSAEQQFETQILSYLAGLTLPQQEKALEQMAPNQLIQLYNMADISPALSAVLQRLDVFSARDDIQLASLSDDYYGDVYGENGRSLWGKLVGGGVDRTDTAAAYRGVNYGLVFGADLYRSSSALAGVAASWLHADLSGRQDLTGETLAVNSYQLTAYGAVKPAAWGGQWLLSGQAAFAYNRYDQDRRIDAFAATARASLAGEQYLASGTLGYIFNRQGYNVTAYSALREVHVVNPHYIEGGAGLLDMQVNAVVLDSVTQDTGVKYDGVTSWPYGKLFPSVKIGWAHDYTNGPIPITGTLAGVTFVDPARRPSQDGLSLGAGANAQLKGWSIGLEYQGEIRSDFQSHTAALKANWKF